MCANTDLREERGKSIAAQGNQIKKINDHSFKVRSQSGNRVYELRSTPTGMTCTCPDFVYRGGKCKHIMATCYYLEVEKDTPKGTVTEKVHLTYAQAWNAYNEAQKKCDLVYQHVYDSNYGVGQNVYAQTAWPIT